MAEVRHTETKITVTVDVVYSGRLPLDARRLRFIEEKLQGYADHELHSTLRVLRFSDETEAA